VIFGIIITILSTLVLVLGFATLNLFRKVEFYEEKIQEFYSAISITLQLMRTIDERQMFEKDDEVGEVFTQLTDIVNDLRPILYGSIVDGETSKESVG
jgi:Na+-translocating ferredoxin:NAD+ oxidoreductase RnfA subunit